MFLGIPLILYLANWAAGQSCPKEYQRFSQQHTFCLKPNPTCQIKIRGLYNQQDAIKEILTAHNQFRNKVALGQERNAGGLPTASNMMQMTWDYELASIAQKWAENCRFQHDCGECRTVENFGVGQNIGLVTMSCPGGQCDNIGKTPDWKGIIASFYDEVKNLDKRNVDKFGAFKDHGVVGHFTQVVWARSWRVGCGFVSHLEGNNLKQLFVCNYGPGGNFVGSPIYKAGPTCSNCPTNSCCGNRCPGGNEFQGLCKMNRDEAPKYPRQPGVLFYCDFSTLDGDCSLWLEGQGAVIKSSIGGSVFSQRLKGGQEAVTHFKTPIKPSSNFCIHITYRKYTDNLGGTDVSTLRVDMPVKDGGTIFLNLGTATSYSPLGISMPKVKEITLNLKFSVPSGAVDHIMDIKEIEATNGSC